MNFLNPIYTEKRECQDCYKCVRHCPVKTIKVEAGCATVISEGCIVCGHCVQVCPSGAKHVRDDLSRAQKLLELKGRVLLSLAPSFISEFPQWTPGQLIAAIKRLGFWGVSETALGAQEVSAAAGQLVRANPSGIFVSSACPTVVSYLQKHRPDWVHRLTGLLSPLLTHCKMLRQSYGPDIGIVFIGPCIAKKTEADTHPQLLEVALTFEDLRRWLEQAGIDPATLTAQEQNAFIPHRSDEGAWYPVDGGMIAGIRSNCAVHDSAFMSFSGMDAIEKALAELDEGALGGGVFLELLACEGGCVNGPRAALKGGTALKRARVLRFGAARQTPLAQPLVDATMLYMPAPQAAAAHTDQQLREAMRQVGKLTADDELDCGGCGYDSCRQFAGALLDGKAERTMCVTYMRKLAQKKANLLIQKMPSAVVIVSDALRIVECNAAFVKLFGKIPDEPTTAFEGRALSQYLSFAPLFGRVLESGQEIVERDLRFNQTILHVSIFSIEKSALAGGIFQDITRPAVQKEQVIAKAQEVIQRNLATVQKIACLLGENAAESEITLNAIMDSFTPPKAEEPAADHEQWRKLYRR